VRKVIYTYRSSEKDIKGSFSFKWIKYNYGSIWIKIYGNLLIFFTDQ